MNNLTATPQTGRVKLEAPSKTVSFYNDIPQLELSLDDFEVYALKRLKVSRISFIP